MQKMHCNDVINFKQTTDIVISTKKIFLSLTTTLNSYNDVCELNIVQQHFEIQFYLFSYRLY